MRATEFLREMEEFATKDDWVAAVTKHGAVEFIKEKEFNLDLIYAVDETGSRLKGTWSDKRNTGRLYTGKKGDGISFDKRRRDFYNAHLSETTTAGGVATMVGALGAPFTRNSSIYGSKPTAPNRKKKKKKVKEADKYSNSYNKDK